MITDDKQQKLNCNIPFYFKWVVRTITFTWGDETQFKCKGLFWVFKVWENTRVATHVRAVAYCIKYRYMLSICVQCIPCQNQLPNNAVFSFQRSMRRFFLNISDSTRRVATSGNKKIKFNVLLTTYEILLKDKACEDHVIFSILNLSSLLGDEGKGQGLFKLHT